MSARTRKVITRSGARVRGYFFSQKSKALIPWESHLEFGACVLAEFDRRVQQLKAHQQQVTVNASDDSFDAYPDFCFVTKGGSNKIVEVKSDRELKDQTVSRRLAAIKDHFESLGTDYEVWSETFIQQEPQWSTLDELLFYRKPATRSTLSQQSTYRSLRARHSTLPFAEAADYLGGSLLVRKFLANDLLSADFSQPLTDLTSVTVH